jgi:hypothetical protein
MLYPRTLQRALTNSMHGIAGQALAVVDSGVAEHPLKVGVVGHVRHVADDSGSLKGIDCRNVSIKPKFVV